MSEKDHTRARDDRVTSHKPGEAESPLVCSIGFFKRFDIYRDLQFNLEFGKSLTTFRPFTFVIWAAFAAASAVAAYSLWAFGPTMMHAVGAGALLLLGSLSGRSTFVLLSILNLGWLFVAWLLHLPPILTASVALILAGLAAARAWYALTWMGRRWWNKSQATQDRKKKWRVTGEHAPRIAESAKATLETYLPEKTTAKLRSLRKDKEDPYRIVRGAVEIDPDFFKSPEDFVSLRRARKKSKAKEWTLSEAKSKHPLGKSERERFNRIVDVADAFAAGALRIAGAMPQTRLVSRPNELVGTNRYWRTDRQETPDSPSGDVFLRFHQSTIEKTFPPNVNSESICTYKTYVAMNNFRRTSVLLLRVSDVIRRLHEPDVVGQHWTKGGDELIERLEATNFQVMGPRTEFYSDDNKSKPTQGRRILYKAGDGKNSYVMAFDPARVWEDQINNDKENRAAIMALRVAIDHAARFDSVEVVLGAGDLLIVNNLRMLVGRREDCPDSKFPWRDVVAAFHEPLRGRWMRQTYGFPVDDGSQNGVDFEMGFVQSTEAPQHAAAGEEIDPDSRLAKRDDVPTPTAAFQETSSMDKHLPQS